MALFFFFFLLDICQQYSVNDILSFIQQNCFLLHWKCQIVYQILTISTKFYFITLFEKKHCWNSSYSCENLWRTCSIRSNMQRLVSTIKKWRFRLQQQRQWETTDKLWRCRIECITGRRFNSNPKTIHRSNWSWPNNYFRTFACHWKDPERRKIGVVLIERKASKGEKHSWNFARSVQKKVIFASSCYWRWKMDLFPQSPAQKIIGRPWPTINITTCI